MSTARLIPAAEAKACGYGDMKMARDAVPEGQIRELIHRPVSDRVVLVRASNTEEGCSEWYMIGIDDADADADADLKENTNNDILVSRALVGQFGCEACWSMMGSTLYVIGGVAVGVYPGPEQYSGKLFMFDATQPHDCFIEGPPMIRERSGGISLAHDGKLFMFGGTYDDEDDLWAEYFDPKLNKWNPMPQPPIQLPTASNLFAIPFDDKHVLVGSCDNKVLLYNTQYHYWRRFPHPIYPDVEANPNNCVKVGNVVYWLVGRLYAYDLETQKSYSARLKGSEIQFWERRYENSPNAHPTPLFHCGGNVFCYIWYTLKGDEPNFSTVFNCEKIRVVFHPAGHLDVTLISTRTYVSDHALWFVDAKLLDRKFVQSFISKTEERFSGSSSGGKAKRSYASALVAGLETLNIKDPSGRQTVGKHV